MDANHLGLITVLLVSLLASLALVPLAGAFGRRVGFVDKPRSGEVQRKPMPRTGGYGLVAALLLGIVASLALLPRFADEYPRVWGLALGILALLPLAFLDDWKRLSPLPQFAGQIAVAFIPIAFGITIDNVAGPFGGIIYVPGFLVVPLTVLWIVGMMNTINLTDTMDGLAGGIALIAASVLGALSLINGQFSIASLALALAGACAGFLVYNFHPARIIMGSSGSLVLGYALAVTAIIGGAKIATAVMVLGLPILDVAWVIVYRLMRGRSPFAGGDNAHLSHRLLALGWSQRQVTSVLCAVCLVFGVMALVLDKIDKVFGFALLLAVAVALMLLASRGSPDGGLAHRGATGQEGH